MRTMILSIALVSGLGIYAHAQATASPRLSLRAENPPMSLSLWADTVTDRPVNGYDGVVRVGPPDMVLTASGNVVIVINGVRITADTTVWYRNSLEMELDGGTVHLEFPARPSSITMRVNN